MPASWRGPPSRVGRKDLPLVLHPDAWRAWKVVFPSGTEIAMPPPDRRALERAEVRIVEEHGPSVLLGDGVLVTRQVERVTDFKGGFPWQHARADGGWEPDPWIWDDQGVVCRVKGRGLVVVSSCSHAGVINVLRNAVRGRGCCKSTGSSAGSTRPGACSSRSSRGRWRRSRGSLPDAVVLWHCTGWRATHAIARRLPGAYVQTSVGTVRVG